MLADVVVVVHFAFVLFVVFGGLLVLCRQKVMYLHLPAVAWGAFIEYTGGICPLTPLENSLRARAGLQGYQGGFIEHYLVPVLYPSGLTRNIQFILGSLVIVSNLLIYALVIGRKRRSGAAVCS